MIYPIAILTYLTFSIISFYSLWVCYIVVMSCRDKLEAGKFTTLDKLFGYPTLFVGFFIDFIVNLFVMTVLYCEIPQEFTVSERSLRHAKVTIFNPDLLDKWRKLLATWLLAQISWYDKKGGHSA
jgi:hypothetical protein